MNKEDFINKYKLDATSVYYYKKRFPEIVVNKKIDYNKLEKIIEDRLTIKEKVKSI